MENKKGGEAVTIPHHQEYRGHLIKLNRLIKLNIILDSWGESKKSKKKGRDGFNFSLKHSVFHYFTLTSLELKRFNTDHREF